MSDRRSVISRMQERRTAQQPEASRQAGSVERNASTPMASASAPAATGGAQTQSDLRDRIDGRRAEVIRQMADRRRTVVDPQTQIARADVRRDQLSSRLNEHLRPGDHRTADVGVTSGGVRVGTYAHRPRYLQPRYHDRPDLITHHPRHVHTYYDAHHRLSHRVIWPRYYFTVGYHFGSHWHFRYVYPYYHRKYVFISLGGYWPYDYTYTRYYWYGWHPYVWYGYYPIAREVGTGTNNYYTYNYYGDDGSVTTYRSSGDSSQQNGYNIDMAAYPNVRARLEQQSAEPAPQTQADTRFEEAVKSFESGDYRMAAQRFAVAMEMSPEDMILPFAYAQALFADRQYTAAANVLREALKKVSPEKEGVFYPRGLYADDDVLFKQVEELLDRIDEYGYDADLQLLLGYHLLGTGETGYAREPLERARQDQRNAEAAAVLIRLLEKIETEAGAVKTGGSTTQGTSDTQVRDSSMAQMEPARGALSSSAREGTTGDASDREDAAIGDRLAAANRDAQQRLATGTATRAADLPAGKEDDDR